MLTARAEYRLRLRADNAEVRLTPDAIALGCVGPDRLAHFGKVLRCRAEIEGLLAAVHGASTLTAAGASVRDDGVKRTLADWLRFPEVDAEILCRIVPELQASPRIELERAVQDHRYAPYVARQLGEIVRLHSDEAVSIPADLDFSAIAGLSNEMVERLTIARPATLGAASRIRGITPAALAAILVHARRKAA
jgi:tRNA uridine 5-carboxymethylaminomethyl modification enzyme